MSMWLVESLIATTLSMALAVPQAPEVRAAQDKAVSSRDAVPPSPPASARADDADRADARLIPDVDIADGCEEGKSVTRRETVDADGRRHIRIRICQTQIETQAHSAARAGLIAARAQIAAAMKMSDKIKADVLRDLDKEIAHMDGEE